MRLFLSVDIEGVHGVSDIEQLGPEGFQYEQACRWMTAEVNAVCEAAYENGVEEIVVADAHGNGLNLLIEELPDDVQLVRSWPRPLDMAQGIEHGKFDAAMLIGYHSGAHQKEGVRAHTFDGRALSDVKINGQSVCETGFFAALIGEFGTPVVLVSGDDFYVQQAREVLGDVEGAILKWSCGTNSTRTLMPRPALEILKEKTAASLGRLGDFKPHVIDGPIDFDLTFKTRMVAEVLEYLPIVERLDGHSIRYTCPNLVEASKFLAVALRIVA